MSRINEAVRTYTKGLTDLSAKTELSVQRLEQLSSGADPSLAELRALAEALKVGITDLAPLPKESRQAGVLFRGVTRNKQALEDALVDTLSRKMGYSLELLQRERAKQPWWTT